MQKSFCVPLAAMLLGAFLLGCAARPAMIVSEHSADASMKSALSTIVYHPGEDGSVTAEEKLLPWEVNMGNYALSFVFADGKTGFQCRADGNQMLADIQNFPVFGDAAGEQAAIVSIVNTLTALPGVERVALTFDGEKLAALKNGTPVNEAFGTLPLENAFAPTPEP